MFAYSKDFNPSLAILKDSIPVPKRVKKIVKVCAYIDNGDNHDCRGFLSIYNEKTNEQLINTARINNDKRHFNFKAIHVLNYPQGNNLNFVMNFSNCDSMQKSVLHILLKYTE